MHIIKRTTNFGQINVSTKSSRIVLDYYGEIISDAKEVARILDAERFPISTTYEITGKCNYNCYYCYAKNLKQKKDLKTSEVKKIIDKLYEKGVVFLQLTGGEPLVRKDFLEILKYINEKKFILGMFTNGSCFNEEIIDELKKSYIKNLNISLLAPTEELYDKLAGVKGSFSKFINNIRTLKNNNIRFLLVTSLTSENINLYEEYKKFEEEYELKIRFVYDVGPTYDGYNEVEKYALNINHLAEIKKFVGNRLQHMKTAREQYGCSAGLSTFGITNEGKFLACQKLRFEIGSLVDSSFDDLWESKELKKVICKTSERISLCKDCKKKEYCLYCLGEILMYEDIKSKCNLADLFSLLN